MLEAIVFDFDGVICNTEPLHGRAFARALAGCSIPLSEKDYLARYAGLNDRAVLQAVFQDAGRTLTDDACESLLHVKNEAYFAMIANGIDRLPGVDRLVPRLARQWPLAICSGARRVEIETILRPAGLFECFQFVVSADEVASSKPDPAGYLETLKQLRRILPESSAADCLAIEDTEHGVAAARAAGLKTLAVCGPRTARRRPFAADATVPSLRSVTAAGLAGMFE